MKYESLLSIFICAFGLVNATHFYFPPNYSESPSYYGYLWRDSNKVHLRPLLQAVAEDHNGVKGEICGITPHGSIEEDIPFSINLINRTTGYGEIIVKSNAKINFEEESTIVFEIEAYDCQEPPNFSQRVPVSVYILNRHGPVFDSLNYQFTVSQNSPAGTVVGKVTAISESRGNENDASSEICDYQIGSDNVPFVIDRYGVIRVQGGLETRSVDRPYTFKVFADDCHRPTPLSASANVRVELLKQDCQQGWKGLAPDIEYRSPSDRAERLFWPAKPRLETCARSCLNPAVQIRLELKSAVDQTPLQSANSQACLHDPGHLNRQRTLCKTNLKTFTNLLPDPDQDLASQLVRPSVGSPPRLMAPMQTMRFNGAALSVWELDPNHLSNEPGINVFDTNFTLSFWMRRQMGQTHSVTATAEDREETIICSQDQNVPRWRFLSVSFRECRLIVRMMASFRPDASFTDSDIRSSTEWIFEPLPEQYCSPTTFTHAQWHHYAITFNRAPWASTTQLVSLLIDGHNPGLREPDEILTISNPSFVPADRKADPRITIGACFDPETRLTKQHLNAELAGMTLLLNQVESPSVLRCMAQCGESLFVPNVLQYLLSDISVTLESDAVTVSGQNISHVADMLTAITYIRPQPDISPDYTTTVAQSRLLTLKTIYQCPNEAPISIPSLSITLNILPEEQKSEHQVEQAQALNANEGDAAPVNSIWVPEERPSVAVAEMERRAKQQEADVDPVPILRISGPNVIVADPATIGPGVPLFSEIKFKLWDKSIQKTSADTIAASVPLDSCHVWLASSGDPDQLVVRPKFHAEHGERIEWPTAMAANNGFSGRSSEYGVEVHGRKPAGEYARLLREFRYWPPITILTDAQSSSRTKRSAEQQTANVNYMANFELICALDAGKQHTSDFMVKVLFPDTNSSPQDRLSKDTVAGFVALSDGTENVNYGQSDRERRRMLNLAGDGLIPLGRAAAPSDVLPKASTTSKSKGYVAGIVVCSLLIVAVLISVVLLFVYKRDRMHRSLVRAGRRPRVPAFPADFGGSSLKRDPTLRLTANPVGEMDYYGIGTLRENIHGSTKVLAPKQYIFSPPTTRREGRSSHSSGSANLAGLEEFDAEYVDPSSDGILESDVNEDLEQIDAAYRNYGEDHEGDGASDFSPPSPPNDFGADICDWIDDDDEDLENPEQAERNPLQNGKQKYDLVAIVPESDLGSPVAHL